MSPHESISLDWSSQLEEDLLKLSDVMQSHPVRTKKLIPGERRDVAVLFLDIHGFTNMSENMDHETVHRLMDGIFRPMTRLVASHGGYVDKYEGDNIMALFGAKHASENDCVRAVSCGMKMQEIVNDVNAILSDKGIDISSRVGISYGSVTIAPDPSGHLTAIGDVVNVARRMESTADLNTVQITSRVREECGDLFAWMDLGEKKVKGKEHAIQTYSPTGPGETQTQRWERAADISRSPLVGRTAELEFLENCWNNAAENAALNRRGGAKHLVAGVCGEAGIGKSRLVHDFIEAKKSGSEKFTLLTGQTLSYAQPPFWLWTTLLRNYFEAEHEDDYTMEHLRRSIEELSGHQENGESKGSLIRSIPFLAQLLSIRLDDAEMKELDDKLKHQETLVALRNFIRVASCTGTRVVILLEDIHWMDSASLEALEFVVSNTDIHEPLLLICVYRPETSDGKAARPELPEEYAVSEEIVLSTIEEASILEIARMMLGGSDKKIPREVELFLLERSGGNPFFMEEMILHLIETGIVSVEEDGMRLNGSLDKIVIPSSLSGILRSRIDNLPSEDKQTLRRASILGMEFQSALYREVCRRLNVEGKPIDELDRLVQRNLLEVTGTESDRTYSFRHILTLNSAYDTILHHNCSIIHRMAAESLIELYPQKEEVVAGFIARHWEKAGNKEKALEWGMKALKISRRDYNHAEVLNWSEQLLSILETSEMEDRNRLKLEILDAVQSVRDIRGEVDEWQKTLERMMEICEQSLPGNWTGRTLYSFGKLHRLRGDMDEAEQCFDWALNIFTRDNDRHNEGKVLGELGNLNMYRGDLEKAEKFYRRAIRIHKDSGNQREEGMILTNLCGLFYKMGHIDRALEYSEKALAIHRRIGNRRIEGVTFGFEGAIYRSKSNIEKALSAFQNGLNISREIGDHRSEGNLLTNLGLLYADEKQYDQAVETLEEGLSIQKEVGNRRNEAIVLLNLGNIFMNKQVNQFPKALQNYENCVEIFKEVNDMLGEGNIYLNMGVTYYRMNELENAEVCYLKALDIYRKTSSISFEWRSLHSLINLMNETNRHEEAKEYCRKAVVLAAEMNDRQKIVESRITLAKTEVLLGRTDTALKIYKSIHESFESDVLTADMREDLEEMKERIIEADLDTHA